MASVHALAQMTDLDAVRADLNVRIAAIDVRAPYARAREIAPDVDAIRAIAHRNGLNPAVTVAHFLDSALSRGECGALVHGCRCSPMRSAATGRTSPRAKHLPPPARSVSRDERLGGAIFRADRCASVSDPGAWHGRHQPRPRNPQRS